MPTYEYKCKNCHHQFDIVQSFADDALTTCPDCRKKTLRKVFAPVGIVLKGSGFYKNDSRSGSGKTSSSPSSSTSEKSDSSSSSADSSSPDKSSDSKSSTPDTTSSSPSDKKSSSSEKKSPAKK